MNRERAEKQYLEMENNSSGWRFSEVEGILEAFGISKVRQNGSDSIFKHHTYDVRLFVSFHGSGRLYAEYVERACTAIKKVKELENDDDS